MNHINFPQKQNPFNRRIKSRNITYRNYNLKLFNVINKTKNSNNFGIKKNSCFIIDNNLRPLSNNKLMNKSRNNNKSVFNSINKFKTFNTNDINKYESESKESSDSYYEDKKNKKSNKRKKFFINGRKTTNYEKFCYELINSKLTKSKADNKKKKLNIKIKYNEKVFSRNNQILIPQEELKRQLTNSSESYNSRILKSLINSINNTKSSIKTTKNFITKTKNEKILKKIIDLNDELHEFKYYIITDLINKEQKIGNKIIDIKNKLNPHDKKKLVIKNIIYEKLEDNKQTGFDDKSEKDKDLSLNELLSSFDNLNKKKFGSFVEKKFIGEIKKMNNMNIKDSKMSTIFQPKNNYNIWKHNIFINQVEEEKMKKERKKLFKNMKKMKNLAEIIYNIKRNNL